MRKGSNAKLVRELCAAAKKRKMRVRVGGGIRTVAQAARIAGWGAEKIIVGSAAFKDGQREPHISLLAWRKKLDGGA